MLYYIWAYLLIFSETYNMHLTSQLVKIPHVWCVNFLLTLPPAVDVLDIC